MGGTGGVVAIMGGVLVLYLVWAANSPFNRGRQNTTPGGTTPQQPGGRTIPFQPPNPFPGPNIIPPIEIPIPEIPNPTDPCNPIYIQFWGNYDCIQSQRGLPNVNPGPYNIPSVPQNYYPWNTQSLYMPYGYGASSYAQVGYGWPYGTPYGTGVA